MAKNYIEVDLTRFNRILDRLSDASMIDLSRFDLIVHGRGGQEKEFYAKLKQEEGLEILMSGSVLGKWSRLLSFIPSEAGLVRVLDPSRLKPLFEQLGGLSISEIFYIPRELTNTLAEKIFSRDQNVLDLLDDQNEYLYLKARLDDYVQHDSDCYYLYDYRLGPETAAVIKTVFNGL
jgi:hypothetical protein